MRLFVTGSAPLLIETFNEFRERTGHTILERYGMSETVMLTSNPYHAEGRRAPRRHGRLPAARRAACACSDDQGAALPGRRDRRHRGARARTSSRATGACRRRPPRSSPPTAGSRPATSARSTRDGYVTIVGRSKDLIITGGYNVYPAEIEGYLNEHARRGRERGDRRAAPRLRRGAWSRWSCPGPAPQLDGGGADRAR